MSSSDSEDDIYGNAAKKLQNIMKKKYQENLQTANPVIESKTESPVKKRVKRNIEECIVKSTEEIDNSTSEINDELFIENLIANNPVSSGSKRKTRAAAKNTRNNKNDSAGDTELDTSTEQQTRSSRRKSRANQSTAKQRGRGRGRGRGAVSNQNQAISTPNQSEDDITGQNLTGSSTNQSESTTSQAASTSVQNQSQPSSSNQNQTVSNPRRGRGRSRSNRTSSSPYRSRGRRRGWCGRPSWTSVLDEIFLTTMMAPTLLNNTNIPTYSVGNTEDYPDQSDNQTLFSKTIETQDLDDLILLDDTDPLENEEMSVKIYWQSSEIVKFSIRKFQKLTQVFEYFSKRENVAIDKLYLTYNDRILKPDDTPDSISYSIAKFIDGGIVTQSVTVSLSTEEKQIENGIKIKFQCQYMKKPYEAIVGLDDKFSLAMMKFAEHLEKPVDKLKFEFDGDSISGKKTAREMELEGGECIDVKVMS